MTAPDAPDSRPKILTDVPDGQTLSPNATKDDVIEAYKALALRFADLATQCLEERRVTNAEIRELKTLVIRHGIAPASP
jgi:hypothetical protein